MYGLFISLGILFSALTGESIVKKMNKDEGLLWGGTLWAIIFGIIGARIYHVIDYWSYYSTSILETLYIWKGGLGIYGALLGGAVGLLIYYCCKKEKLLFWLDIAGISVPIGQTVGRWGNFFNQEIFGPPTKLPWGIYIERENRPDIYSTYDKFHPLFLYEAMMTFFLYILLVQMYKRLPRLTGTGLFAACYLLGYGIIRFSLEFLRITPWKIGYINVAQAISLVIVIVCIPYIIWVVKSNQRY